MIIDKEMNLIINISNNNICETDSYENNIKKIIISKIECAKWYNIMISLNMKSNKKFVINTTINAIQYEKIEIENNHSLEKIENIILFKNYIGLSTSFLLYNKYIDNEDIILIKHFQYGLYKITHIKKYFDILSYNNNLSLLNSLIILIIPFQIKGNNIYNFANMNFLVENFFPANYNINNCNVNISSSNN